MDAISDRVFTESTTIEASNDDPSLLTVILDISPAGWFRIRDQISIHELAKSLLVFMNAHLSLNNSNQVAFIASSPEGSKFLYPNPNKNYDEVRRHQSISGSHIGDGREDEQAPEFAPTLVNRGMYRQFRVVDEAVLEELNECFKQIAKNIQNEDQKSTLSGALSMALAYTNRMLTLDQSISTTTASAINSTTSVNANAGNSNSNSNSAAGAASNSITSMRSRILIVSANDEDDVKYIPIMNSIFAAQKMKTSIDIAKLGFKDSSYLQQASDATNGIYLHIDDPRGIIQVLTSAFFVEPSIRPFIILPTNSNVNYRASCFITGKSVDVGYVCSVCLCIMSIIPETGKCPACSSIFDDKIIAQLSKGPVVLKKRKLDTNGTTS
ncbi:TFIIH subunit Tfb4/p34 [Scheffersomyces xylosifermentans]|uniref:TFIIH subunit Tfb4/p34 n=1 Tax=Scheffersomyces xylosifermentans TaxID=1304137 RepID=UPI00315CD0E6